MVWLFGYVWLPLLVILCLLLCYVRIHNTRIHKKRQRAIIPTQPTAIAAEHLERLPSQDEIDLSKDMEEERIVGLVEPVGFWTKKILAEKLQFFLGRFSDEPTYWQNLVQKQNNDPKKEQKSHARHYGKSKPRR